LGKKEVKNNNPSQEETVVSVSLSELHPFPDHPFKVRDVSASDKMNKNAGQKMQVCSGGECNMVHSTLSVSRQAERVSK